MSITPADVLLNVLREANIIDAATHRVVIDLRAGQFPIIYTEKYGSDRIIEVIKALSTVDIAVRDVAEREHTQ